jgi:hypothetical protein
MSAGHAAANERFLEDHHRFHFKAGVGGTFGPQTLLFVGNAEYAFDRFLSVGPTLQAGFGSRNDFFISTIGGRLSLPIHVLHRVKVSIQTGLGLVQRKTAGFSFTNFAYAVGPEVDIYVLKNLTVGVGGILNITSSDVQRKITSLYASATYSF